MHEIHKSKRLSGGIQRQLDGKHAEAISRYLTLDPSRFFNAIVVGVYGGNPQWAELAVTDPHEELTDEEEDRVTRSIGILVLTGKELLLLRPVENGGAFRGKIWMKMAAHMRAVR